MRKRIRNYHLLEEVASGGHATVHRAWDAKTDRIIALKVLHPHLSKDPLYLARFEREATLASSLQHPNVVPIYEVGKDGESHFIAMEFMPLTLELLLKEGEPLSIPRAVDIARQVACGLEAARKQDIVHRDIKPQNILLDPEGWAKITDFGIARTLDVTTMTHAGLVTGTPQYMAPEQAKGAASDVRADLYSLGVLLYQMLTGRLPFRGETPWDLVRQHVEAVPQPVNFLRPEVPKDLQAIVDRCLQKDPEKRYQTPQELAVALAEVQSGLEKPSPEDVTRALREVNTRQMASQGPATLELPPPQRETFLGGYRGRAVAMGMVAVLALAIAVPVAGIGPLPGVFGRQEPTAIPTVRPTPGAVATGAPTAPATAAPTAVPSAAPTAQPTAPVTPGPAGGIARAVQPIQPGQTGTINLTGTEAQQTGVVSVSLTASTQGVPPASLEVTRLPGTTRPPTATFPPGKVYSYLDLNLNPSAALAKATMRFVVPQAWIAGQQIDASTVALYSYDGQWSKLPTTRVDFVEGGTVYEGIAPHLSYFAVAAEVQAPATATPTPPVVDVLVLNQDVLAGSSTAVFTMNAIPWRLQYRTSWSGKVALSARTAAGNSILLTEHQAVAGFLYETHIYGVTGTLSLSAAGGPSSGSWTVWVTANPATPRADTPWVFTYTGTALANTPQFDVASSPWLLSYETTWSGPLVLAVMGPDGPMRVVETEVTAGTTYLTHVYGVRGKVFLFAENAPPTGRWTVKVNAEPKLNNVSPPALLTYTGTGRVNSPPFTSDTPMFRLVYLATWSGPFRLVAQTSDGTRVLVDREVQAGVIYEVYVSDVTGPMYLTVVAAPPDRAWSLSVWRVEPPNQT